MSIFNDDLPIVKNNKELDAVKLLNPKCDPYYVASACIEARKMKFNNLWPNFEPYADTNFLTEIKTSFHTRTWEMYLCNVLLGKGFSILKSSKKAYIPKNEGPDFVLKDGTYIECIAVSKGSADSNHTVPEPCIANSPDEIICQDVPTDKMILRVTSAIKEKGIYKYQKWQGKTWFNKQHPYIIAINSGELFYSQDYLGFPLIIKALFGLQYLQIDRAGNDSFSFRSGIEKGPAAVPVQYFTKPQFSYISGIIFSDETVLNHPENIGNDCIFVNNPFADNPVNSEFFEKFKSFKAEEGKLTKLFD